MLDLFVAEEPGLASGLAAEIDGILRDSPSEPELKKFVIDDLGDYYLADRAGTTYRAWLQQIAERVRSAAPGS